MARLLVVAVLVALEGCSLVFVSGPPPNHRDVPSFSCSQSYVAPVVDTVLTLLETVTFVTAAGDTDQLWADKYGGDPPISRSTAIPLYGVLAAIGVASMYHGYSRVAQCRCALRELELRAIQPKP
ncbi:MAG TPA: hypothetical protein VMJ10_33480 [Kofleriaceae bacterium]|nr:hypothetical protein [Kofleriaceae bacterium]